MARNNNTDKKLSINKTSYARLLKTSLAIGLGVGLCTALIACVRIGFEDDYIAILAATYGLLAMILTTVVAFAILLIRS